MHELVRNTWIIAKREFVAYFSTPLATVFLIIFIALTGAFAFYVGGFSRPSSNTTRGCTCCWCRQWPCGCGPRSASRAPSSS